MPKETKTVKIKPAVTLPNPGDYEWNFVLIHRHGDPLLQWWGNFCSSVVTRITLRADDEKPIRWYHKKLFDFCYKQYDKYGDYYRIIDNSFGNPDKDDMREKR